MVQKMEFRVSEEDATRYLGNGVGTVLGESTRVLMVDVPSPLYTRIAELEAQFRAAGRCFFTCWDCYRKYTSAELTASPAFKFRVKSYFEPCGEECGTTYDESTACPVCRAGATQSSPLRLKRYPKSRDFACTIGGEIVVSKRVVDLFESRRMTGARFGPVFLGKRSLAPVKDRFQLLVDQSAEIAPQSQTGNDPFDPDEANDYRCPLGDTIGLNLLSELYLVKSTYDGRDIVATRQFTGSREGLLRPHPHLVISQRLYSLLMKENIPGFRIEVAHLV
jgi:hypothetical protein